VREHGFVELPRTGASSGARFGESYAALAAADVPYLVTLDALFWVAHVARDRALAAAEDGVLVPALETILRRLEARLEVESKDAPADLAQAYPLARGVISVARALLSPPYHPPVDLAHAVGQEQHLIAAHAGQAVSPLMGVTIDYSQIVARGAADASATRAAYAKAVAWLAAAPFALVARSEVPGAELSVSGARAHARAALLVARLIVFEIDAEAAYAGRRWTTLAEFAGGKSDDISLRELLDAATAVGIDVRQARSFVDVVKIDKLRHALLQARPAHLDDGAAIAGAIVRPPPPKDGTSDFLRPATSIRLLPSRTAPDAEVMQALVYPSVGKLTAKETPPPSARDGVRALPRALDVAVWLGSSEAAAAIHQAGDDAYERYADTLTELEARRPTPAARHASMYASSLDALSTYLARSEGDPALAAAGDPLWRQRKLESALAAWVMVRHDALAFARFPLATTASGVAASAPASSSAPVFVEPHPEAIGALLALVRQTSRGLRSIAQVPDGSPAIPILDASEKLLADALDAARRQASDEPLSAEERAAMSTFPARLAALEQALVGCHGADASMAFDVHTDGPAGRVLIEATGDLDDLYAVVREPGSGRAVLAVGSVATHYELTSPIGERPSDVVWRARLHAATPPERAAFTRGYVALRAAAEPTDGGAQDASGAHASGAH
jgi:hypothetical protein